MMGIVGSGSSWVYYTSRAAAPSSVTSGQSTSGNDDVIYMTSSASRSSATYLTVPLYPLCEVAKDICKCSRNLSRRARIIAISLHGVAPAVTTRIACCDVTCR